MAVTYGSLKNGSTGEEVRKLQQQLKTSGYSDLAVDGIYGAKTEAAVRDYQAKNGLDVDGIAGQNTQSKLYGTGQQDTNTKPQETVTDVPKYDFNASSDKAYMDAIAALQQAEKQRPQYTGSYDQQLTDIYNKIMGREDFKYNVNEDALYQQYADRYVQQGKMAMRDTMGQAAALTGGYGSTYAQAVGQQQYDAYLQQLNDIVPELYDRAADRYDREGEELYQQYALMQNAADDEYGKYRDEMADYLNQLEYLRGNADTAYDRFMTGQELGYEQQQDAYGNLVSLITSTGYQPTAEELKAAGMTSAQADAYRGYFAQANAPKSSGGGSYRGGGDSSGGAAEPTTGASASVNAMVQGAVTGTSLLSRKPFTGSTYSEAVAYLTANGVPNNYASNIMTKGEWARGRSTYLNTGKGGAEVKDFANYEEYLKDVVAGMMAAL